jgi:hypothetical protein
MFKTLIFPLSLLIAGGALAQAPADPDADLKAKKPPHELQIDRIEFERRAFQRDLAKREEVCLKRFYSAGCIEEIRTDHLRSMRSFDVRRETELQALRDIDAEIRSRSRARRAEEKLTDRPTNAPNGSAPAAPSGKAN